MSCLRCAPPRLVLACLLLGFPLEAAAQRELGGGQMQSPLNASGPPVIVSSDRLLARRIEAADDYIRARDWPQVVRILQTVLDRDEDSFRPQNPRSTRQPMRWASLRAEAEQILAGLPQAGKDFYQVTYDPPARRLLRQARRQHDVAALHEVVRRYRFTAAGTEALALLGSHYLDRGQHALAAACYQCLLEQEEPGRLPPAALLKALLAFHGAGSSAHLAKLHRQAWEQLQARADGDGIRLGERTFTLEHLRQAITRQPRQMFGDDTLLFRRDPLRSAQGEAGIFVLEPRWHRGTAVGAGTGWLRRATHGPHPVWPGASPLAVGGKIVYRAQDGIHALDAATGKPIWHTSSPLSLSTLLSLGQLGKKVQLQSWLELYGPELSLLCENTTLGTLSSDGRRVFAVEDLPLPPPPSLVIPQEDKGPPSFGPLRHDVERSRLRALDLEKGRLLWEIFVPGTAPRTAGQKTEPAYFLGPPLPLGDRLFVLVDVRQDVQLLCLDAASGELRWRQTLAGARDKVLHDLRRRVHACHLSQAGGILVCPTGCGAVLGVDLLTGSLRWAHLYRQPAAADGEGETINLGDALSGWRMSAPLIHGDRVIFTAADCPDVLCLNLHTGALCWKSPRRSEDLHVACIDDGRVLVAGKKTCRALALAGGNTLWEVPTGAPAGQGILCQSHYYLPLLGGDILVLDLERPERSTRLETRRPSGTWPPGNLISYRGLLWSQNAEGITAYIPLDLFLAQIEAQLARRPNDRQARFERAGLRQARGQLAGAVEDLHEILGNADCAPDLRRAAQGRLYSVLTQWLERDFPAAEKLLPEYRSLCRVPLPTEPTPARLVARRHEENHRQVTLQSLLARGRQQQGRLTEALQACQDLLALHADEQLLLSPDDTIVRLRPDLWAQKRVAGLLAAAPSAQRQELLEHLRRRLQSFVAHKDAEALDNLARLLAETPGEFRHLEQQARLGRAQLALERPGRAAAAEVAWDLLALERQAATPELAARALFLRAELLARHGQMSDALSCYRRLAHRYPHTVAHAGRTGADLLAELRSDRRFLPFLDPPPAWPSAFRGQLVAQPGPQPSRSLPFRPQESIWMLMPGGSLRSVYEPSPGSAAARRLNLALDRRSLHLLVTDLASGRLHARIPLPLSRLPGLGLIPGVPTLPGRENSLEAEALAFQARDYLVVLMVANMLFGIDLLEGRLLWQHDMLDDVLPPKKTVSASGDGVFVVEQGEGLTRTMGNLHVLSNQAIFVHTDQGLLALDPARGSIRWMRSLLSTDPIFFGEEDYVFVGEAPSGKVSSLHMLRARDGTSVPIPDSSDCFAQQVHVTGQLILLVENGDREEMILRVRDLRTGKDVWHQVFPPHSVFLSGLISGLAGALAPDGTATVVDLVHRDPTTGGPRLAPKMHLDKDLLKKVKSGFVLADSDHFYVALNQDEDEKTATTVSPFLASESVPLTGPLFAFHGSTGRKLWHKTAALHYLLLDHFEDSPLILLGAQAQASPKEKPATSLVSIDKRNGKVIFEEENVPVAAAFSTLRLSPYTGTMDLLGPTHVWRHSRKTSASR